MDKLRVAFFSDTYLPAVDGVVTSMLNFKKELKKKGHKIFMFVAGDSAAKRKYQNDDVFIVQGINFKPYPQYKVAVFPYMSMIKINALDIDIIHAQTPFAMGLAALMSAKILGKPIIGSYHTLVDNKDIIGSYYPKNKRIRYVAEIAARQYIKFFYSSCDCVFAPSGTIKRILEKKGIKNVYIVPNSVDIKRFNPEVSGQNIRRALKLRNSQKVILYVGRISREKKLEVLLNAAHALNMKRDDIVFVIGGHGPALEYYKRMAEKLKLDNLKFVGFIENKKLAEYYAACDVFCIPSTFETQGMVALEAMACGKPVVGADYLALKELIKNGKNGEKFKPGSHSECARKIEKVLNSSDKYTNCAIDTANEFSLERTTQRMLDLYNFILSKS